VSVGIGDSTTHAHLRNTLEQTIGDMSVSGSDSIECAENSQDTVMDAGNDLADASANTSLVAQLGNVQTGLANDDACFLRGDDGSQSELSNGILVVGAGRGVFGVEAAHRLGDIVEGGVVGRSNVLVGRHAGYRGRPMNGDEVYVGARQIEDESRGGMKAVVCEMEEKVGE
jgi:hypothetical protein